MRSATGLLLALLLALVPLVGCGDTATDGGAEGETASADSTATADGGKDGKGETEEPKKKPKKKREKTLTVNAAAVTRNNLVIPVVAEGQIRARKSTEVKTVVGGRLDRVAVQEGQHVKKGQLIAQIDNREHAVALEEARSQYLEALGRLAADRETLESKDATEWLQEQIKELDRLEKERTITHKERMDRELELEVEAVKQGAYRGELVKVRSGLSAARAAQDRAELNLENTEIRAPFSGVITKLVRDDGERISNGDVVCELVDNINLEAAVAVLESDLSGLGTGRTALLEVPALEDSFFVSVDVMSPQIDTESRTCEILMRIKNTEGRLRPGMFVRASIAGEVHKDRLLVPKEAILIRENRPLLFKIKDNRAEWVYITLGMANDEMVEITKVTQGGPLDPGTLVVVSDHLTLTHNAKVKVRKVVEPRQALAAATTN